MSFSSSVGKYPSLTSWNSANCFSVCGLPMMSASVRMPPYGGSVDVSVAATTPGSAWSRGRSASKNRCFASAVS